MNPKSQNYTVFICLGQVIGWESLVWGQAPNQLGTSRFSPGYTYPGMKAGDVAIFEPPHRGDDPMIHSGSAFQLDPQIAPYCNPRIFNYICYNFGMPGESIPEFSKTKVFSAFAVENKEAMYLLRKFGLLSQSHEEPGKKAWGKIGEQERSYRNIAEHSLVVGMTADVIYEQLEAKGIVTEEQHAAGTKGALLHDLLKRGEIEAMYLRGGTDASPYLTEDELGHMKKEIFEQHGLSEADVAEYSLTRPTSYDVLAQDPQSIDINESPDNLREWITYFADLSVAHTSLVGPQERVAEIRKRGIYNQAYIEKYKQLLGQEKFDELSDPDQAAEFMMRRMEEQGAAMEGQIKELLEIPADQPLIGYIKEKLEARYQAV